MALVLEDMHWADSSTRMFVSFLARSLRSERVLLVLTFRTDELHRRHPLRALLAELDRLGRARRIDVEPFDRAELTEALADILGDAPAEELVARLYERSEGNPLFTEELLAAGLDGRGAAPASLRDAFLLRVERLSADAQRAARAIAAGRQLDQATIAEVTGLDGAALTAALREAVDEQVLVSADDKGLAFRHALLREAVADDLLPGERGSLHLALARAFERTWAAEARDAIDRAGAIAFHYAAAGDQPAALRASTEAALVATRVHAYAEVAELEVIARSSWHASRTRPRWHSSTMSACWHSRPRHTRQRQPPARGASARDRARRARPARRSPAVRRDSRRASRACNGHSAAATTRLPAPSGRWRC